MRTGESGTFYVREHCHGFKGKDEMPKKLYDYLVSGSLVVFIQYHHSPHEGPDWGPHTVSISRWPQACRCFRSFPVLRCYDNQLVFCNHISHWVTQQPQTCSPVDWCPHWSGRWTWIPECDSSGRQIVNLSGSALRSCSQRFLASSQHVCSTKPPHILDWLSRHRTMVPTPGVWSRQRRTEPSRSACCRSQGEPQCR